MGWGNFGSLGRGKITRTSEESKKNPLNFVKNQTKRHKEKQDSKTREKTKKARGEK